MRGSSLTLLEVLLVVVLLCVGAGALVWRLDRWVQHHRLQSDALRLKSLMLHARSLALHTQADWQLTLTPSKRGVDARLVCREEAARAPSGQRIQPLRGCTLAEPLVLEFYSSGALAPLTPFKVGPNVTLSLSELFQQKETPSRLGIQPE